MTVLGLPLKDGAGHVALVAFLGGLSAATAMVIVETVAVAIMISNHLVVPIVLRRRGSSEAAEGKPLPVSDLGGFVLGVRRVAIFVVILLGYAYYRAAGDAGARGDRPALLRGGGADRAGVLRRAVLVARHGARSERRARHRFRDLGLHAAPAEPRARGRILDRLRQARAVRDRAAQADRAHGARGAAADPWRAVEPRAQPPRLCRLLAAAAGERRRAAAGDGLRRHRRRFGRAELPAFSGERHRRRSARDGRALSRRGAHQPLLRGLRQEPRRRARGTLGGRHPPPALCRAPPRLGDRRRVVAARAVAAAAPPQRLVARRAAPPRRRLGGDPVQPRPPAARPRPCPPGHHRARPRPSPPRLEPRLHRPLRAAAGARADRRRPRRDRPLQRRARLLRPRRRRGAGRRSASAASSTTPSRSASGCSRPAA